jgi:hypothetical protein
MKYEELQEYSKEEVEVAISKDHVEKLILMVVAVSMHSEDSTWAESVCFRLASHSNINVRGNAILGFGHIARVYGKIESTEVKGLLEAALVDEQEYVRGQAHAAADDVEHFLGWQLVGTD